MTPAIVLAELVRFAAAHGEDIAELVGQFIGGRPDLMPPPDTPANVSIDNEIDALIDGGKKL